MAERIVLHRKPHPSMARYCWRWFTYAGRDWGLLYGGPGYGWSLSDLAPEANLRGVRDGYRDLREVRDLAPSDIDRYLYEQERKAERGW